MRNRALSTSICLLALLGAVVPADRQAQGAPAAQERQRLVVLEFHSSDCASCRSAGEAVEVLAEEYSKAGKPAVFVEYNAADYLGNRTDRWYDANADDPRDCGMPLLVVDSGWRWSCGWEEWEWVYSRFVNEALSNPPGAQVTASYTRSDDDLEVSFTVRNQSGVALGPDNSATANVIVYERAQVLHTSRYARAAEAMPLEEALADGGQAGYHMRLEDVPVSAWDEAVVLVLLDYRPDPSSSRYESLQAALADAPAPPSSTATASPTVTGTATPWDVPSQTPTVPAPSPGTPTTAWQGAPLYLPLGLADGTARAAPLANGPEAAIGSTTAGTRRSAR